MGKDASNNLDFPRDSGVTVTKQTKSNLKRRADDEEEETAAPAAKKYKRTNQEKPDFRQKPLSFHLEKDLLILGCVSQIKDYEVLVSLPDGLNGRLPITNICDAYTENLEQLASGNLDAKDGVLSLHNIFHTGSVVRCCITELDQSSKKKAVVLSVNPRLVNRDVVELINKSTVSGVVSSSEDHGFVVDLGINGVKAFLPKSEVTEFAARNKDFADNVELSIGSYLTCLIQNKKQEKKSGGRTVTLTINPKKLEGVKHDAVPLQSLLPGMVVDCVVQSKEDAGIFVNFGNNSGIIFNNCLEKSSAKYKEGDEVVATVLYVQPSTKMVVLSPMKHLLNPLNFEDPFASIEIGDIYAAKTLKAIPKVGLYVKLTDNMKGFVKKNQVSDKTIDIKTLENSDALKVRVIGYDYLNQQVLMTMKESLLKMTYFNYQDIKLGQVIECTIKKLNKSGLIVKVTGRISGLVPILHLSDIPLTNPEKKFKVGKQIKCRVLFKNNEDSKLILTHKKSLLKPKNLIPFAFEEIVHNSLLTGFVVVTKPQGILVAFGDEVKGWVPKKELSYGVIAEPEKEFYLGQVVNCRVMFCNPAMKKVVLSLKILGDKINITDEKMDAKPELEANKDKNTVEEKKEDAIKDKMEDAYAHKEVKKGKKMKVLELACEKKFNWEEADEPQNIGDAGCIPDKDAKPKSVKAKVLPNDRTQKRFELEKTTLLEPNNSQTWINLIVFEVEQGDVEKAREVSERAIRSISFREEQQKLDVHLCRLNLEHEHGNSETLKKYIEICMSSCDQLKVMSHIRDLYASSGETDKSLEVCRTMIKKFKGDPMVWVSYGEILYRSDRAKQARTLLEECVSKLDRKDHVLLTTKFALLESEYGASGIADTMFESLLRNFPKRTDILLIYVDRCIKLGQLEQARKVLRAATSIEPPLPKKKAAVVLKKFIAFEEKNGSPLVADDLKGKLTKLMGEDF